MKELILVGGGGHCHSVIDVIHSEKKYRIIGILDPRLSPGSQVLNYEVLGNDELSAKYIEEGAHFLVTVGKLNLDGVREKTIENLTRLGAKFATVISSFAHVSDLATVGEGSVVHHGAIVNVASSIGRHCIINTSSVVEHDVKMGDFVHLSTMAIVNGHTEIAAHSFIASHGVISHNIQCRFPFILGANSFMHKAPDRSGLYVGSPARFQKEV